jgi:proton-dependent oligopeptide transporter, POT family
VAAGQQEARPAAGARPWHFPRGAQLVIGFEFCERVGFYSMVSLLALFLSAGRAAGGFAWQDKPSLTLLGIFSGLMYALPVLGGWIADRVLGHRRALTIGGTLMFGAYLLLTATVFMTRMSPVPSPMGLWSVPDAVPGAMQSAYLSISAGFWISICALVAGNSLIKSTLVVALGDTFSGQDARREPAYAYYYAGINLGGLVAGVAAGSVAATYGWAPAFGVSAIAMGIALAAYLTLGHRYLNPRSARVPGTSAAAAAADTTGSGVRLFILAVFAVLLMVYAIGSFQLWGTMSLFLERSVNRHVNAFEIPTQWFTSIESAALILAAPAFAALWGSLARRNREPDNLIKYALALFLGAAGLLLFAIAAWPHAGASKAGWLLPALGIWIQATGEVAAWTVTYGLVYRLAPQRIVSAVMGAFYAMTLGLGGYLAGQVGTFAEHVGQGRYFLVLGGATAAAGLVALLVRPGLRALAASKSIDLYSRTA